MKFTETKLKGAYIIELEPIRDKRGFFARTWNKDEMHARGLETELVQGNISFNMYTGTLRGMHYQAAPHQETKLVRVTNGAIYDCIIDLRRESPTYKQWTGIELTRDNYRTFYVPKGCAHGYITLCEGAEVIYWVSAQYEPAAERGIRWDDPQFGIQWPVQMKYISEKDANRPDYKE